MRRSRITQITLAGVAFLFMGAMASGEPAAAQGRDPRLADSETPGSVIVFPKFIRGFVDVDGVTVPQTEFEVGVVCPASSEFCPEGQKVKIRFHYVCGSSQAEAASSFICRETDFDAFTTVNGKLVFNPEGLPPGNTITPIPQCDRGYLIGWVINPANDLPIKFDGLIGNAVIRNSDTAVSSYKGIPIQADPALATGAQISLGGPGSYAGSLVFDGGPGHYLTYAGRIFGDVRYDTSRAHTTLTFLTLDVKSNRPNYPTFVDINFYNSAEALLSSSTEFICWGEKPLTGLGGIDQNLTVLGMGSRKGVFVTDPAEKLPFSGVDDIAGPATLLGLVETAEGPTLLERHYIQEVFHDGIPVPTFFRP
jgi:hypothetical protein